MTKIKAPHNKFSKSERSLDPAVKKGFICSNGFIGVVVNGRTKAKHCFLWERENGPIPKGRRLICIDGNKQNTAPSNWKLNTVDPQKRRRRLWEATNGPIPKGMVLRCLDGNSRNADPSNWEPVPPGVIIRTNYAMEKYRLPEAYRETAAAIAKLQLKLRVVDLTKERFASDLQTQICSVE